MKKLFTLLTLLVLLGGGKSWGQLTTKTWDFKNLSTSNKSALITDVDETHKAKFKDNSSNNRVENASDWTKNTDYALIDANGDALSDYDGLLFGRDGNAISKGNFQWNYKTANDNYIYFNNSKCYVKLPSIKAGQEVVIISKTYEGTVTITNGNDDVEVTKGKIIFTVKEDGAVKVQFTSKMADLQSIEVKNATPKHTITYSLGTGTGTTPTQTDVREGSSFTVAAAPDDLTAPTGKEFKCWNDGTTDYDAGDTYTMGTSNVTLTAVYQTITTKYTITYNLGEGTGTAPTQTDLAEGAEFTVADAPGDLTAPTGKEFKCWNDGSTDYNAGDTYTMSAAAVTLTAVYQDKTYKGLTPTTTLDLSDASNFAEVWYTTSGKMVKNFYYDAPNGVAVISAYAAYQAKNATKISWMTMDSGNSSTITWDATGVFKGSSYYFESEDRVAAIKNSERIHYYRVTNCSSVSALVGGKAILEVYEVSAGVVTPDPVEEQSVDAAGTITISGLDISKEYIIAIRGNNGSSGVAFREIAFNFPAVSTVSVPVGTTGWSTYSSSYALDFGNAEDGIEAYAVTGFEGTTLTTSKITGTVAANTGLLVKGTASTSYNVPIVAEGDAATGNKLVAVITATTVSAAAGTDVNYVLVNNSGSAEFQWIGTTSANVGANKAYLSLASGPKTGSDSRGLAIDIDIDGISTGINMVNGEGLKVNGSETYYDLQGRRVLYPTKGLYIVNGKKVVIK